MCVHKNIARHPLVSHYRCQAAVVGPRAVLCIEAEATLQRRTS